MAHKKGVGSTDNGRDSNAKYLGVKLFGGQFARAGNIIVRQRGTKYHSGENTYLGKDFTLHAKVDGIVTYRKRKHNRTWVSIVPEGYEAPAAAPAKPKKAVAKKAAPAPKPAPVKEAPMAAAAPVAAPAPAAPKAKVKAEKVALPSGKKIVMDDLKMVEGIGPKIEGLLHAAGIMTWNDLAEAPVEKVQAILDEAGPRYRMHQPTTWAKQSRMAANAEWAKLEEYQDYLDGGREPEGK